MNQINEFLKSEIEEMSAAEFLIAYPDLLNTVFGTTLADGPMTEPLARPVFSQQGWRAILIPFQIGGMDRRWDFGDADRDGRRPMGAPVNWLEAIMLAHWSRPASHVFQSYTAHFVDISRPNAEPLSVIKVPAIAELLDLAGAPPTAPHWSEFVIDAAGEWGMIDASEPAFTMLGAKGALLNRFVSALGGMEEIQAACAHHLKDVAAIEGYGAHSPKAAGERLLALFRPIYDRIGWPWPFADHIGKDLLQG